MLEKIKKYYHTLKYLKKSQLAYLVKNRLERGKKAVTEAQAPDCRVLPLWLPDMDAHTDYLKRFCLEDILNGKVELLYETGRPGGPNWANPDKTRLWNFNLHYLEFLIPLAAAYKRTKDIRYYGCFRYYCGRWEAENKGGTGDVWHPYPISLRLTNLWICIDGFKDALLKEPEFFRRLNNSMYAQYLHLQKNPELHLLGNHYFENLKAVLLGALYFQEPEIYEKNKKKLLGEIKEQILADGVHYERSLMYHKIILEDLLRVSKAVGETDRSLHRELAEVIGRMADAMYSIEGDMGHTPLFNDAGDNVAKPFSCLLRALKEEFTVYPSEQEEFSDAGYYCLKNDGLKIVMDAGRIAPDYMPGHGHCDGLSFELAHKGRPIFVNSGTGQYQGTLRSYFRSTAAHNTVVIDGREQSECWGEHRVSRRISKVSGACGKNQINGKLTTCSGRRHERSIGIKDRLVVIRDKVKGHAQSYLHLAPEYEYVLQGRKILVQRASSRTAAGTGICEIRTMPSDEIHIHKKGVICSYAPEFGRIQQIQVLEIAWEGDGSAHMIQINFTCS